MKNFLLWLGCYFGNLLFFILIDYLVFYLGLISEPTVKEDLPVDMIVTLIFSLQTYFFILEMREKKVKIIKGK